MDKEALQPPKPDLSGGPIRSQISAEPTLKILIRGASREQLWDRAHIVCLRYFGAGAIYTLEQRTVELYDAQGNAAGGISVVSFESTFYARRDSDA